MTEGRRVLDVRINDTLEWARTHRECGSANTAAANQAVADILIAARAYLIARSSTPPQNGKDERDAMALAALRLDSII